MQGVGGHSSSRWKSGRIRSAMTVKSDAQRKDVKPPRSCFSSELPEAVRRENR